MQHNWRLGFAFASLTAFMWGVLPFALGYLLHWMDSVTITWYRFLGAAVVGYLIYGRRAHAALKRLLKAPLRNWMLACTVCLLGNYILFMIGLELTTPEAAEIIIQIAPLLLLVSGVFIYKEAFSAWQWLGVAICCTGLLLFFQHRLQAMVPTGADYILGVWLVVFGAIVWVGYGLIQKKLVATESSNDVLLLIYIAGAVVYLPPSSPAAIGAMTPLAMAVLAFAALNTIIAYGAFGRALTHWSASRVSAVIAVAPLITLMCGGVIHKLAPDSMVTEPLGTSSWLGGIMVVLGSMMAALAGRGKAYADESE